jgi:hypothetical protein
MWAGFEGVARTRDQTLDRVNALNWTNWRPQGITLHNTAAPTLAQWAESGPSHDARIRNLQSYYENELGWHAGPHWFVSRNWINWFSNPLLPGVHSRCFNATRFGIEMVGDYNAEEFDTGDGALVRDNAVFLIAALNLKFGFSPEDLTFHKECRIDNHDCPGHKVVKTDVIAKVRAAMTTMGKPIVAALAPSDTTASPRMLGITATMFGGEGDEQNVAYQDVAPGWPDRPGVALPARFADPRPKVRILMNGRSVVCDIVDLGPWYPSARGPEDKYWETDARPRSESDPRTNRAGIDLTPAAAKAVGLNGKGIVDWEFFMANVKPAQPAPAPTLDDLSKRIDQLEALIANKTTTAAPQPQPDPLQALLQQVLASLQSATKPTPPATTPPASQTNDLVKNIAGLLKTFMDTLNEGTTPAGGQLGPVNGALGDTIGNLLNGKKSGLGIIGALLSSVLPTLLPLITSNAGIIGPISAASGIGLPISLALAAWGALGKLEKWSGNSSAPPTPAKS